MVKDGNYSYHGEHLMDKCPITIVHLRLIYVNQTPIKFF